MRQGDNYPYKFAAGAETREGKKWELLGFTNAAEINGALAVLDKAYRKAGAAGSRIDLESSFSALLHQLIHPCVLRRRFNTPPCVLD